MFIEKKLNHKHLKLTILFLILIVSFWRSPYIFFNGRFVGEEATHHFLYALENNFLINLFYYDNYAGYINLLPNLLLWVSTKLPIELAPLATVYGSFFFIILLPYLCLFRESEFLDEENKKIIASLILFLSPPFVSEVWINSLNSQLYLCLISILILFMKNLNNKTKLLNHILLFLSGLSGVYTCGLLPLFALKFFLDKSRYNFINVIILLTASLSQLSLIIYSKLNNALHPSVLENDFSFDLVINFFYNIIAKSFLGRELTHLIWNKVFLIINHNYLVFFSLISFVFLIFIILRFKSIIIFIRKNYVLFNLILIFFIISIIVSLGSLGNQVGGRYAVIPGALLILCILEILYKTTNSYLKSLSAILLLLSLTVGMYDFRPHYRYLKFLDCINCPDWKSEIKIWRTNKDHIIGIWPYPLKTLDLSNTTIN